MSTPLVIVGAGGVNYADAVIADGALAFWRLGEAAGTDAVDRREVRAIACPVSGGQRRFQGGRSGP